MRNKNDEQNKRFPCSWIGDGLDDDEEPMHQEMIEPEDIEYEKGLKRIIEFNTY